MTRIEKLKMLCESAKWLNDCAEGMEEEGLDRENNARHFRNGANAITALPELLALVEQMRDALMFYANNGSFKPETWQAVMRIDNGDQADKALEAYDKFNGGSE